MRWDGSYRAHAHASLRNVGNAALCACVLLPAVMCAPRLHGLHPVLAVNLLFLMNVTIGFWLVGLVQRSFWLIDPFWSLLPPLIGHFYQLHPGAASRNSWRANIALVLTWIWSVRLTHSYFRREDWKFGQREDWRYTKMAQENPSTWPVVSFFAVGLAQQPMLVGITLPLYSVHFKIGQDSFGNGGWDLAATLLCAMGLVIAWISDNQLRAYMIENERRVDLGLPRVPVLNTGFWKYSRHPNYFGEQLWWWALALFSVGLGDTWVLVGAMFNSLVLLKVTYMTESRIRTSWSSERVRLYEDYCKNTSMWIPLPPAASLSKKSQ